MTRQVGVCSWSLRPESPSDLVELVRATGASCVQLALGPLCEGRWEAGETSRRLADAGIAIRSGMMATRGEDYSTLETIRRTGGVRPDGHWPANLAAAAAHARVAAALGVGLVTFHAGFLPHEPRDPLRQVMLDRVREVAAAFSREGVGVGLETGQETAATLLEVLDELGAANVGVNFDPANMILYGMGDPTAALQQLSARVVQIHIKDARAARRAGAWGEETRFGEGEVDWREFFRVVRERNVAGDWMIEREGGDDRVSDIREALSGVALFAADGVASFATDDGAGERR
ncbi:MAG: sugar phosphate isomerase/epimerase [Phycisphaerae bacterium]|nr:MAG: sugar phosphate isomerase/epimerase [Planctomycetota bacterium]KAB2939792.1 MAG: sugar phosphate isomerase/epimerase [Phycisphaerae bacterium]MBE7456957.1 sugar phosphate isomerase/epimerase [Planctomycetia bacterium]MCK6463684.1 sugar phosphate isomerase/epimerase [Phycisphaerae bacterium]MCL4718353.1 sugar phosphate isomerase/epimerase [Phycisphaerae bacterium]